ncbi:MAG: NAD(P)/FAD-dependent oxidoreductase [Acidobacteriota bacterium]
MPTRELVVVGAGPAGMAAAIAAAEAGLPVTVVDEGPRTGGQIYRQPPAEFEKRTVDDGSPDARRGEVLLRRFEELAGNRIEWMGSSTAWGLFPPRRLAVERDGAFRMIDTDGLILAPGAYEMVPPFPGWTLPGVMTPGAAQVLAKSMGVVAGRRIFLAGTGPFLLVVALALHRAGAEVVGIAETVRFGDVLRAFPGMVAAPALLRQGWGYLRALSRAGIPVHRGHSIVEARGGEALEEISIAPCDADWFPDRSRTRRIEVDTLCVGYGFVPRTQLAQLAGCHLVYSASLGGWIPHVDDEQATSVDGVWVAGDGGGVAGSWVAELEGRLAGLSAARRAGALDEASFRSGRRHIDAELGKLRRFRAALDSASRIRPGLDALADGETLVCRCEELTRSEVDAGVDMGATDARSLKVVTRLGMGPCQGRMCWPSAVRRLAAQTGRTPEEIGAPSVRPPIRPVSMASLAALDGGLTEASPCSTGAVLEEVPP